MFSETIELEDKVTPVAKAAAAAMRALGQSIVAVGMLKVGGVEAATTKAPRASAPKGTPTVPSAASAPSAGAPAAPASTPKVDGGALKQSALLKLQEKEKKAAASAEKKTAADAAKAVSIAEREKEKASTLATAVATKNAAELSAAMTAGKEIVGGAIGGIKNAFTSLAAGDVKGAVAGVTEAVSSLAKTLDLVVPGLGQAVAAVVSIVGGFVGITAGLVQSGIELAISATQGKDAMLSMFDALGDGNVKGLEVDDMLSGLSDRIGISKDKLSGMTKEFLKLGVTGREELESLTLAAISANAIVGEGGAAAFEALTKKIQIAAQTTGSIKLDNKFIKGLSESGLSIDDLARSLGTTTDKLKDSTVAAGKLGDAITDATINKGAKALDRLGSSFAAIKEKFMSNIGDMFEDLGAYVGPAMDSVKDFFSIFSQANPAGQALKGGVMAVFGSMLQAVPDVMRAVKIFFEEIILHALLAYNGLRPLLSAIKNFGGAGAEGPGLLSTIMKGLFETIESVGTALKPTIDKLAAFINSAQGARTITTIFTAFWSVAKAVGIAVIAVVAVFATLWVAATVIGVTLWTVIGTLLAFGATLTGNIGAAIAATIGFFASIGTAIADAVGGAVTALTDWVAGAAQYATDFVAGLVGGITGGAAAVADSVKGLASGAVDAFTGFLGIKSPSTVMAGLGAHTGAGFAQGVESTEGDVYGASSGLAQQAVAGASATPAAAGAAGATGAAGAAGTSAGADGGGGGATITFEPGAIVIDGAGKSAEGIGEELLSALLERFALQAGVA